MVNSNSHELEIFGDLKLTCLSVKFCWLNDVEWPQFAEECITYIENILRSDFAV